MVYLTVLYIRSQNASFGENSRIGI